MPALVLIVTAGVGGYLLSVTDGDHKKIWWTLIAVFGLLLVAVTASGRS